MGRKKVLKIAALVFLVGLLAVIPVLTCGIFQKEKEATGPIDYDNLPPLVEPYQRVNLDFSVLNDVYKVIKKESVFRETAEDPELLLNGALKTLFGFLGIPAEEIPQWARDLVNAEIANGKVDFSVLNEVYTRLSEDPRYPDFKDPIKKEDILISAVKGIIKALGDPFASYTPAQYVKMGVLDLTGTYKGIGVTNLSKNDKGELVVGGVISGSPAEKAGVKDGDVILAIDGKSPRGCSFDEISLYIRGKKDDKITLVVRHLDGTIEEIVVKKEQIKLKQIASWPSVDLPNGRGSTEKELPFNALVDREGNKANNIIYIKMDEFTIQMVEDLAFLLQKLDLEKYQGMIIDLRGNPGGLVGPTITAADFFLEGPKVIFIEESPSGIQCKTVWDQYTLASEIPVVILISGKTTLFNGSYSGAEVFAAALRDNGRAALIGERSGGKGTINRHFLLREGEYGALYIAISLWLTPKGECIECRDLDGDGYYEVGGLFPDIEVGWQDSDYQKHGQDLNYDPQIFAAIDYLRSEK